MISFNNLSKLWVRAIVFIFSISTVIVDQQDQFTGFGNSFYPLRGFGLLMEQNYDKHKCQEEVMQIMDHL